MQYPDDGAEVTPGTVHPDEGTIHAWLDGELSTGDADALSAHLDGCAECRAAVAEARGLVAASARILRSLDDGPGGVHARPSAPPAAGGPPSSTGVDAGAAAVAAAARHPDEPAAPAVAGGLDIRSIDEALSVRRATRATSGRRRWRVPAIAAVGLMAVGTTLVLQRSGPLAPLTAERSVATTAGSSPADAAAAADSLAVASVVATEAESVTSTASPGAAVAERARTAPGGAPAAKAAAADELGPTAPPVAMPPRPPQPSAAMAMATAGSTAAGRSAPTVAAPDSAASQARSAFASPLRPSAVRDAAQLQGMGVAGAPPPVAPDSSLPARTVGPVLTGRVIGGDGEPVPQALVTVPGTSTTAVTDAEGRFRLAGMPAGEHVATVRRIGFEPARLPLRVAASGDSVVTVALVPSQPTLGDVVVTGAGSAPPRPPASAAESARRAAGERTRAPSIISAPAAPVPAPAPVAAPQPPPPAAPFPAGGAVAGGVVPGGVVAQRLAGCYRLEIGGAPSADRDSTETTLPGWIRLLATAAADRPGWLEAEPLLPARRGPMGRTGWRVAHDEEVEVVWPMADAAREVVLRLRGSGEVLTGTAALRPAGGAAADEREAASVVAVRGVCNQ